MKRINYGNWKSKKLDFIGNFNVFKAYLIKKDYTIAKGALNDFTKGVESLTKVMEKMQIEYFLKK